MDVVVGIADNNTVLPFVAPLVFNVDHAVINSVRLVNLVLVVHLVGVVK